MSASASVKAPSILRVTLDGQQVGRLAINGKGQIAFEYDTTWIKSGFDLAPGAMPFDAIAQLSPRPAEFEGLHGPFYDSLPDGWGLLLMDRALKQHRGLDRAGISPLDRLAYMGNRCMGALEYEPVLLPAEAASGALSLADIAEQSYGALHGNATDVLEALRIHGGSPGGARPKVSVAFAEDMQTCHSGFGALPQGFSHWIVKFRNDEQRGELEPIDSGRVEQAYANMARAAGLTMPRTGLIETRVNKKNESFFAVQRFDREHSRKIHFLSLSGYIYASHRVPSLDYVDGVLPAVRRLTRSALEVEKAFRLMVFNVLAHNKDDHAKNFAFLRDPKKDHWELAPAFDLTFNHGMNGQHTTSVNGAGNPTAADIKVVAERHGIKHWKNVVGEVRDAIHQWPTFADTVGLTKSRTRAIQKAFEGVDVMR